jgi:hypothetical protein
MEDIFKVEKDSRMTVLERLVFNQNCLLEEILKELKDKTEVKTEIKKNRKGDL